VIVGGGQDCRDDVGLRGGHGGPGQPGDMRRVVGEPAARRTGLQMGVHHTLLDRALSPSSPGESAFLP
jgi:hypothetical protein